MAFFLGFWLLARTWNIYPYLHPDEGPKRLAGADSYFHLRHSEQVAQNYPHIQRLDPLSAFPSVERGLNQGFYDLTVATISKLSLGLLSPLEILIWCAPILFGLAACAIFFWLWRHDRAQTGLLFLLMLLAFPGPIAQVCALGEGDHHAFEIFLATLLFLALDKALAPQSSPRWCLPVAAVTLIFLLSWAGAPLHLLFLGLCFFAAAFPTMTPQAARALRTKGVVTGLLITLSAALVERVAPALVPYPTALNIALFAGLALALGYPVLLAVIQRLPGRARLPVAIALLASVPLVAQLSPSASGALAVLFERRASSIAEHGAISLNLLFNWYGLNFLALGLAPVLAARQKVLKRGAVAFIYGLGLVAFWLLTRDFNYYAAIPVAASAAFCLARLPWRRWTPAVVVVVTAISLLPGPYRQYPWLKKSQARNSVIINNGLAQTSQWLAALRRETPQDQEYGMVAPWDLGNILAATSDTPVGWSQTHSLDLAKIFYTPPDEEALYQHFTREPNKPFRFILVPTRNLEDKFGTELQLAGGSPQGVFVDGPQIQWEGLNMRLPTPGQGYRDTFIVRLFDGLAKNLGHFRLVYQSPQQVVRATRIVPSREAVEFNSLEVSEQEAEQLKKVIRVKNQVIETSRGPLVNAFLSPDVRLFEIVPGAVLTGQTRPHSRVGAMITLTSPYDQTPQLLHWTGLTDAQGKFQLRLPYPTTAPMYDIPGTVQVHGPYRLEVGGRSYTLELSEEEIQQGAQVPMTRAKQLPPSES